MTDRDQGKPKETSSQELQSFGFLEDQLSFYIRIIEMAVTRDLDISLKKLNFSRRKGTITALFLIARHPGVRVGMISQVSSIDKSLGTKIVDELVAAGLVEKRPDDQDGRAMGLYITAKGLETVVWLETLVAEQSQKFFLSIMTQEEHDIVISILRRAFNKMREVV